MTIKAKLFLTPHLDNPAFLPKTVYVKKNVLLYIADDIRAVAIHGEPTIIGTYQLVSIDEVTLEVTTKVTKRKVTK